MTLCLFLISTLGLASDKFQPTITDLTSAKSLLASVPNETKLIVLSDMQHRLPNTRSATLLIAQALAEKYPKKKSVFFSKPRKK